MTPTAPAVAGLYLCHLEPRYAHAGHYLGYADDISRRVLEHRDKPSKASPLLKAARASGSAVTVTRVWIGGDRNLERRLKRGGGLSRYCPTCQRSGAVPASRIRSAAESRAPGA